MKLYAITKSYLEHGIYRLFTITEESNLCSFIGNDTTVINNMSDDSYLSIKRTHDGRIVIVVVNEIDISQLSFEIKNHVLCITADSISAVTCIRLIPNFNVDVLYINVIKLLLSNYHTLSLGYFKYQEDFDFYLYTLFSSLPEIEIDL